MKEFKSVSVKNFFSYGQQEQTLVLSGKDLWNINGPNGKGKTTLCVEAITFAIYGKHREDKIDDCVNRDMGGNCKVSLEFIGDDDETYKIIRYRKHDTHGNAVYLFKGDKDISKKNAKDTDQDIQDLIGMPYIAFINSTIFSSELYSNFLTAKNSDRLVIFENILSLKEITIFYTEIKKVLKELAETEEEANVHYSSAKSALDVLKQQLEDYNNNAKSKLLELKSEKENASKDIEKAEKALEELRALDIEKEKGKLSNNSLKKEYEKQIFEKNKLIEEETVSKPTEEIEIVSKYKDFDFEANGLKEQKYNEALETMKTRKEGYEKAKTQIDAAEKDLNTATKNLGNSESELKKQKKDLESIKSAICPYCGQKMDEEETQKKKDIVIKKISELEEDVKDFEKEIKEINLNLSEFRETYNSLIGDYNRIKDSLNKDFEANNDLLFEKFNSAKKIVEKYKKEYDESSSRITKYNLEIDELKNKINTLEISPYSEDYLNSVSEKIKEQEDIISKAKITIATVDGSVKSAYDKKFVEKLKKDITDKETAAAEEKEKLNSILDDIHHFEYLGECCSNKSGGFKKFFINEMIPLFNENVNKFLPFFFGDKNVEITFDRDLNDSIKMDGKDVTFSSFSRGQKTRAEIAVAFALFNLSRVFFSNKSGLLVVDELLDNGLDEFGIKSAISILESFAQEAKVFVVSHNNNVKDNINNVIEIKTDENGFSYIK